MPIDRTYGLQPYYGKNNQEVIEMIRTRNLLDCPEKCPMEIYNLMLECWCEQSCKRPNFSELHSKLRCLKAVYSNNCIRSSSTCNNNLNTSVYEIFDHHHDAPELNMSIKSRNNQSSFGPNSNSCGNLLHPQPTNSDPQTLEHQLDETSPCLKQLSVFKQSKTIDKSK